MRKERPILFSTPMVQAILEGRKTMTRRVVKPAQIEKWAQKGLSDPCGWPSPDFNDEGIEQHCFNDCPYGKPGDILWVRETWAVWPNPISADYGEGQYVYKADGEYNPPKWKPSIFMPREACRIFLEITNVRVERLQDISSHDAIHEGIEAIEPAKRDGDEMIYKSYAKIKHLQMLPLFPYPSFRTLWQSINGFESWNSNPYVWVVEFKRVHP